MTTNHRPTLEAKRGKAQNIQDSISHSRALPQQRSLKYRNDINIEDARAAVQELKEESRVRKQPFEGKVEKKRKLEESAKTPVAVTPKDETGEKESEDLEDSHSEYSSDDDDDDDETAQLMQELQKIKQEREELKQKLQDKSKQERAISSNPLLQLDSSAAPVKKSWRSSTAFRNEPLKDPSKQDDSLYTNNTLKSENHKKFMSKYIR